MKTTVELPDELIREVKVRAAREGRRLKDVMADVVRLGLSQPPARTDRSPARVRLPLVACAHPAAAGQEVTADRVAELLLDAEAREVAGG